MNLLEMNDMILYGKKKKTTVPSISQSSLDCFRTAISMSKHAQALYEQTDDANSFFALFPGIKQIVGAKICVECFYACKLGYYMQGIPAKLVYVVNKMFSQHDKLYVNCALNSAVLLIKPYVSCQFDYAGESYTVQDVVENLCGRSVQLINTSVRKVQCGDVYEVFIPGANRVALLPSGIGEMLSMDDCERLSFSKATGIMLDDIPIRTLGNRLGITRDDFDLRECI